ncbi:MAG TPA: T9SS type A sorting domain-containing protein [Bacteroidia bacterium]|jgi:hypothetical protein|nr:T9SS type A sorting domain-containing protein [Bacteroidia bacterium]
MKKFYTLILIGLFSLSVNATVHTINVFCTGIAPSTITAVCGDSIKWAWGGCSDSSRSTVIPLCGTPWSFAINSITPKYTVVNCAGTWNFKCYCNTSYFTGTITVTCPLGIAQRTGITSILDVFPNPSNGKFKLVVQGLQLSDPINMEIYNLQGKKIYQSLITNLKSEIDLQNQAVGIYFIKLQAEEAVLTKKIIIQ